MTGRGAPPPVVGRPIERRLLADALAAALGGAGGVVLLEGEGGIGKTTLADELASAARAAGATVARGHGWEGRGAPALVVWHEVVGQLGGDVGELHAQRVLATLTRAARASPLLVLVEDLHAADPDSARVVAYLSSRLSECPVLVVATYRPEEMQGSADAARALAGVSAQYRLLRVPALDAGAAADLVAAVAPRPLEAALVSAVVARGDGNPFLIRELAQACADASATPVAVPAGVAAAVRHRTAQLPGETARLLALAACAGRQPDLRLVAEAAPLEVDEVVRRLAPAVAHGLLEQAEGGAMRFRHALLAEALVASLPVDVRSRHHVDLARTLRARRPTAAAEVVHQLVLAGFLADPDDVVLWSERAGEDAEAVGAPLEAARHWERAVALLPAGLRRGRLLERAGHALFTSGAAAARAVEVFERALGDYEAAGDRRRAAVVHSRLAAMLTVYPAISDLRRAARHFAAAGEVLVSPLERARLLVGTSSLALLRGDVVPGLAEAAEAECIARAAGHHALAATGGLMRGAHLLQLGRLAEAFAELDGALSTARDRPLVDVQAAWHGIAAGLMLEDRALAESYARRARAALRGVHMPGQEQIVSDNLAPVLAMTGDLRRAAREKAPEDLLGFVQLREGLLPAYAGDWDRACGVLAEQADADELAGHGLRLSLGCATLGWLQRLRGRHASARSTLVRPLRQVESQRRVLGELRLRAELVLTEVAAGDRSAARHHLDRIDRLRPAEALRGLDVRLALARASVDGRGFADVLAESDRRGLVWLSVDVLARWAEAEPARALALRSDVGDRLRGLGVASTDWAVLAAEPSGRPEEVVLRAEGDAWALTTAAGRVLLADSKGVRHLARLLASPGREWHALDLVRLAERTTGAAPPPPADDPLVDATARAAYRRRLAELEQDVQQAGDDGDVERAARARAEHEAIVDHLMAATGLGGRDRRHPDEAERARQSVTKTLRSAVVRIAGHDPRLAAHLRSALQTGTFTCYAPDPASRLSWRVEQVADR